MPPELIQDYVDEGRNPDIYTRDIIESTHKANTKLRGTCEAFASFRNVLGNEIIKAIPELKDDVTPFFGEYSVEDTKKEDDSAAVG